MLASLPLLAYLEDPTLRLSPSYSLASLSLSACLDTEGERGCVRHGRLIERCHRCSSFPKRLRS